MRDSISAAVMFVTESLPEINTCTYMVLETTHFKDLSLADSAVFFAKVKRH